MQTLATLNRELQQLKIRVPFVMGDELNPDFIRVFQLTPAEVQQLKTALAVARTRLQQIEASQSRIEPLADGGVKVTVPAFPHEGGEIFDELRHTIATTLGPERDTYFDQLGPMQFDQAMEFGGFGLCESVFTVQDQRDGRGKGYGSWSMNMRASGGYIRSGQLDYMGFKAQFPLLYDKIVASGVRIDGP